MSRNGSGTYSVVNTFVAGTTITASDHNENWSDIGAEITNSVAVDGQSTLTGQLKAASGTVAAPGITFGSDTDSGLYRIGANNIGVAVNGAKVIDVATTGATVTGNLTASADIDAVTVKQGTFALVPPGCIFPYGGANEPDGFLLCSGQAASRTTHAALFAVIGTTYGAGDGSTTFNVPDIRGRVVAGQDDMGGTSANRLTGLTDGVNGDTLGGTGGLESTTLSLAQLPTGITSANAAQAISVTSTNYLLGNTTTNSGSAVGGGTQLTASDPGSGAVIQRQASSGSNSISVTSNNTSGSAHNNVQPTIVLNYIIKY